MCRFARAGYIPQYYNELESLTTWFGLALSGLCAHRPGRARQGAAKRCNDAVQKLLRDMEIWDFAKHLLASHANTFWALQVCMHTASVSN